MKRVFLLFVFLSILGNGLFAIPSKLDAASNVIQTHAEAAALIDITSGKILYSKMGNKQMRIASLTKVMTAIVAIEQGTLSDAVTISKKAAGREGSSIYLKLGEQMSLHNLLYGMMLRSGNDAATAIAEQVGGTEEGFAFLMNEKARMLGMVHSHFINPHGLDIKDHYSTANDMAILTAYALKNPVFREIVQTKVIKVPNPNESWRYIWANKNKMLSIYNGADGVKTGYTKLALRCLISSATRNGQQLAVVTLNDANDWADHSRLLDYGFKGFPLKRIVDRGELVDKDLKTLQSFDFPVPQDQAGIITRKVQLLNPESLSYRLGMRGSLQLFQTDKLLGSIPLVAPDSPLLAPLRSGAFSFQSSVTASKRDFSQKLTSFLHVLFRL